MVVGTREARDRRARTRDRLGTINPDEGEISLNGAWKFRTDPDGMGDRYPDDAVAAYKEDCEFFDPAYDDRDWGEIAGAGVLQAEGHHYNCCVARPGPRLVAA